MDKLLRLKTQLHNECALEINKRLFSAFVENSGHVPHKMVANITKQSQSTYPWLTRDVSNNIVQKVY